MTKTVRNVLICGAGALIAIVVYVIIAIIYDRYAYPERRAITITHLNHLITYISEYQKQNGVLPPSLTNLPGVTANGLVRDAWGRPIRYKVTSSNQFQLLTISPFPQYDAIYYDSRKSKQGILVSPY
jgi:hypothetical protein